MVYDNSGTPYDVHISSPGGDYTKLGHTIGTPTLRGINDEPRFNEPRFTGWGGAKMATISWTIPDDENMVRVRRRLRQMSYSEFRVKRFEWKRFAFLYRFVCAAADGIRKEIDGHILSKMTSI